MPHAASASPSHRLREFHARHGITDDRGSQPPRDGDPTKIVDHTGRPAAHYVNVPSDPSVVPPPRRTNWLSVAVVVVLVLALAYLLWQFGQLLERDDVWRSLGEVSR